MSYGDNNRINNYNGQDLNFDLDGNLTQVPLNGTLADLHFNSRQQLIQVGDTHYTYNAEGHRIAQITHGLTTQYTVNPEAGLSQILIKTQPNGTKTYYVYGIGLIGEDNNNQYSAYHYDLRGSTLALTDNAGQIEQRFEYSPFGILTNGSDNRTPFLYVGQYGVMSADNGLYYMRARYYHPELRRFINQDVILGNIGDGQSLNRFAYVIANPVSFIDPEGLAPYKGAAANLDYYTQQIRNADALYEVSVESKIWKKGLDDLQSTLLDKVLDNFRHQRLMKRYIYTDDYGWIDMKHFYRLALDTLTDLRDGNIAFGVMKNRLRGWGQECISFIGEWGGDYRSTFSYEDLPSNEAGIAFAEYLYKHGKDIPLESLFLRFMKNIGARDIIDPRANFNDLPIKDPGCPSGVTYQRCLKGGGDSLGDNLEDTIRDSLP